MSGKSELEETLAAAIDQEKSIPPYEREHQFDRRNKACPKCCTVLLTWGGETVFPRAGFVPGIRKQWVKCKECGGRGIITTGRNWRFDFAWPERKLAVEVEGGTRQGRPCRACGRAPVGRHQTAKGFRSDIEKYNAAALAGWLVLRFDRDMVLDGTAYEEIRAALRREEG